jgi:hypothetical protein
MTDAPATRAQTESAQPSGNGYKPDQMDGLDTGDSPLALDGWLEFNRIKWGVRPLRIRLPEVEGDGATLDAVVYLDRNGRVTNPARNPYLPVRFRSTPTNLSYRQMHQWLRLSEELAGQMRRRGLQNTINLPPSVTDVRSWQWAGFRSGVRYTMIIDFPFRVEATDKALGQVKRKAERQGFRCDMTTNMRDVALCLADTEQRQGFSLHLSLADLELAQSLLGEEHFRGHICYAPNGEPASAAIALHVPGATAVGWIGGTRTEYLRSGPAQLLEFFAIDDLMAAGASRYDLTGANMPNIANAKASWGARLKPYYTVEGYDLRRLARWSKNWLTFQKQKRSD